MGVKRWLQLKLAGAGKPSVYRKSPEQRTGADQGDNPARLQVGRLNENVEGVDWHAHADGGI